MIFASEYDRDAYRPCFQDKMKDAGNITKTENSPFINEKLMKHLGHNNIQSRGRMFSSNKTTKKITETSHKCYQNKSEKGNLDQLHYFDDFTELNQAHSQIVSIEASKLYKKYVLSKGLRLPHYLKDVELHEAGDGESSLP
jgi:hypothetical protein